MYICHKTLLAHRLICTHTQTHTFDACCACKISIALKNSTNTSHPMWTHTPHVDTHTHAHTHSCEPIQLMWNHIHLPPTLPAPPLFSITNSWGLHSLPLALPDVFACLVLCNTLPYVRQNYPTWMLFSVGVIALVHSKLSKRWMEMEGEVKER